MSQQLQARMMDQIYATSNFWSWLAKGGEIAWLLLPVIFLAVSISGIVKFRSLSSLVCFLGATAALLSRLPWIQTGAELVTMPAPQPVAGGNPFLMFFALYGERFGLLLFGVGLLSMILSANVTPSRGQRRQP